MAPRREAGQQVVEKEREVQDPHVGGREVSNWRGPGLAEISKGSVFVDFSKIVGIFISILRLYDTIEIWRRIRDE